MGAVSTPGTPRRTVRVADDLWLPFVEATEANGENPSDVLRESIEGYLQMRSDETWSRALEVAAARGENLDDIVRDFLLGYIASAKG